MSRPKRSLSQNFLVDPNLQRKIVGELDAGPGDAVLEIGPGHGELTRHLVGHVGKLTVVEKDERLAAELAARWGREIRVVTGDALELELGSLIRAEPRSLVLSNLPYGITTPLLFRFLDLEPPARRIVVTVQKEVGERLAARPGSRAYGALTVGVQARADVQIAFDVGRGAFRPVPDVDSACVRIQPVPGRLPAGLEPSLRTLTRAAFGWRRKQIQKILRASPELELEAERVEELCEGLGLRPRARPEDLSPDDFLRLAAALAAPEAGPAAG